MRLLIGIVFIVLFSGCCDIGVNCRGCTDSSALNEDFDATKSDGSCEFSNVTFFIRGAANGPPLELFLDGNKVGTLPGIVFPFEPGNCSTSNTVSLMLMDGESHDWEARALDGTFGWSGVVSARSSAECIKIAVNG